MTSCSICNITDENEYILCDSCPCVFHTRCLTTNTTFETLNEEEFYCFNCRFKNAIKGTNPPSTIGLNITHTEENTTNMTDVLEIIQPLNGDTFKVD